MVTRSEARILKERALLFLENAKSLIKQKVFDLAAFNLEQFCQLYLKHKLVLLLGDFPKTHSLRVLMREIQKIKGDKRIEDFLSRNASVVGNLESAYITSRYFPKVFEEEEVKQMLDFCEEFKRFVDKL